MSTTTQRTINVAPDVKLYAVLTTPTNATPEGTPPTLIFLHFWGGSSRTWDVTVSHLSPFFPTVAFDTRGWAQSTGPSKPDAYSITALAGDVTAVVSAVGIERYILVGISIGAKIAAFIAGSSQGHTSPDQNPNPNPPAGIVLVSPAPPTPLVLPPDIAANQERAWEDASAAEYAVRNFLLAGPQPEEVIGALTRDMLAGNAFARRAWTAYGMKEDVSGRAARSQVPALIVAGEKDLVEPVDNVERLVHGVMRSSEMVVVRGSGHLVPVDAPRELADHIAAFANRLLP
ncbi:hypothetical protein N3K66_006197 [Trichothecium roseum]|uniref:Uncharacterized protein n=1 Tax=Trichothecium roseum TaxID=47278 RepID=A0ACC0V051_9HYPO|nr:hypothetical protein N3K66_006197 [Trichothecium roseum]